MIFLRRGITRKQIDVRYRSFPVTPSRSITLGLRQQQREQDRAAFAVDRPVDQFGAETALKGDGRGKAVGDVIAEAFEREQETGVGP